MRLVLQNGVDVNQSSHPTPLREDPVLSYRKLTASEIAIYIGPNRYQMFLEALTETGRDEDIKGNKDVFWDVTPDTLHEDSEVAGKPRPIYGAEDVYDDRWTLLHWASYNGSSKVKRPLLLKDADPEHLNTMSLEESPTLLTASPFVGR